FIGLLMIIFSKNIYYLWIGKEVDISYSLSISVGFWVLINMWNSIFSQFLNGIGKLRIQLILGLLAAIINIPLSIVLGRSIGLIGVVIASIIVGLPGIIIYPLQYKKIIRRTGSSFWHK